MLFDTANLIFDLRKSDLVFAIFNAKIFSPGINLKLKVSSQSITKHNYFLVFVHFTIYFNVHVLFSFG